MAQRAIVQIIQPFLDPHFDELSLGYRPGRSRTEALARAELIARRHGRMVWIAADLKDAFTAVPHEPLEKALYEMLGERPLIRLIRRIIKANGRTRGVAQGGPLSPLLLNVHLHRSLDRTWQRCHPEIPLIRVADDLLLLCRSGEEAHHAYRDLQRILQPTGMRLKGSPPSDISDLGAQETVEWLGYVMTLTQGVLTVRLSSRFMAKLQQRLQRELAESDGALRVGETLRGVVDQLGPCYPHEDPVRVIRLLIAAAQHIGVEELPSPEELLSWWRRAHVRYLAHHDLLSRVPVTPTTDDYGTGQGSAAGHRVPANLGRGGTDDTSRVPHMSSAVSIDQPSVLVTASACLPSGIGSWASHLSPGGAQRSSVESGVSQRTTRHRMELVAVIHGLQQLPSGTHVELVTSSQYVAGGIVRSQTLLRRSGGRRVASGPIRNWDLWRELYALLGVHCVHLQMDEGVSDPTA